MLQYLIKFSISLAVLYIFYRAVLRPLTFYQCNRFYLLGYSLLSFAIPFIDITPWVVRSSHQLINNMPTIGNYTIEKGNPQVEQLSLLQRLTFTDWVLIAFCAGAAVVLIKLVTQYLSLRRIREQAILLNSGSAIQLYETNAPVSPFSFGNAIYFNRQLHTGEELQRIIQHEFVHVKQRHTIDLLLGELLCVVNWFNPFAWLIRNSIRQNLEFIADNNVVANGLDKKEYQYLLLKVVGIPQYSIASNFNFSNLKKRIAMMNKMKSTRLHLTKFLFVLPLMAVLLLAFRNKITDHNQKEFVFSGIVYDAKTWQPLNGVAITERYSGLSASTDANGYFRIKIPVTGDSIFTASCNLALAGYENANNRNIRFFPTTDKKYADLIFAGMRKQNDPAYNSIVVNSHYQLPVNDNNKLVPDPDYEFVQDKFIAFQKNLVLSDKIDELIKDSKKPIWVIDGIPYAIGNGARAWFDKEEVTASPSFKVWVDGRIMNMEEANALVNRFEVNSVGASATDNSIKAYGINSNVLVIHWKTKPTRSGTIVDTIPAIPPAAINKKGYIITIADNQGECVVLVKDKSQKIIKAVSLTEWNKTKKDNESLYGSIPPPPPPVVVEVRNIHIGPVAPEAPVPPMPAKEVIEVPIAPSPSKLPANVKNISIHTNNSNTANGHSNTAIVTLISGAKEKYNLNDPKEKAAYIKKYGAPQPLPVPGLAPTAPRTVTIAPAAPVSPDVNISRQVKPLRNATIQLSGINHAKDPLFIVDGREMPDDFEVDNLNPDSIVELTVLKDADAVSRYGEKARYGVVIILTKQNSSKPIPTDVLIVLDGKELPIGSKIDDVVEPDEIESVHVLKDNQATIKYGEKGKKGVIEIKKKKPVSSLSGKTGAIVWTTDSKTLKTRFEYWKAVGENGIGYAEKMPDNKVYFIDGVKASKTDLEKIDGTQIKSINVLKGTAAIEKYKSDGINGVIEIKTKSAVKSVVLAKPVDERSIGGGTAEGKMTANIIYIKKPHLIVTGGNVSTKGKIMVAEGALSFEHGVAEMPLVIYNGKKVKDTRLFKVAKASYKLVSMDNAQGIAKYGDNAKYGALEIKSL
ncbi:MAG: M56 family metallopeptidase [Chitinophagaceae bacterium]